MSAKNWSACPKCFANAERAYQNAFASVLDSYGKIPIEEFNKARDELKRPVPEDFNTFREDYEIYPDAGTVIVDYSGRCTACGAGTDFKLVKPFWPENGDIREC